MTQLTRSKIRQVLGFCKAGLSQGANLDTVIAANGPSLGQLIREAEQDDDAFEKLHPRALKLMRKKKDFIVVADDEPYYLDAYKTIRAQEKQKGTWTEMDEKVFQSKVAEGLY